MPDIEIQKLASDEAVNAMFENTKFGSSSPREVIADTLLKIASGYSTGSTAIACCMGLDLIKQHSKTRKYTLTVKGGYYLYEVYSPTRNK